MIKHDPQHYRKLSLPFPSHEAANRALEAFFVDVQAARDKHLIADVVVITEVPYLIDVGDEHDTVAEEVRGHATASHGDEARKLPMLASAYGAEQVRHEQRLARIVEDAKRTARR